MVKNTLKLASVVGLLLLIPTGTIDDLLVIPFLIKTFGYTIYIMIALTAAYLLYRSTEGKTLSNKISTVRKELKQLFRG